MDCSAIINLGLHCTSLRLSGFSLNEHMLPSECLYVAETELVFTLFNTAKGTNATILPFSAIN